MYQSGELVMVKTNYPVHIGIYWQHKILMRVAGAERQIKWEGESTDYTAETNTDYSSKDN